MRAPTNPETIRRLLGELGRRARGAGCIQPELALYEALGAESDDPYFRFNALRAELSSFRSALEARVEHAARTATANAPG